jgi:hypothetical protein
LLNKIVLSSVIEDEPWRVQAVYEAVLTLVRMPQDSDLLQIADRHARLLYEALSTSKNKLDVTGDFQIKEVLSMYLARKIGTAQLYVGILVLSGANMRWRNDLAAIRIGLATCIVGGFGKRIWEYLACE